MGAGLGAVAAHAPTRALQVAEAHAGRDQAMRSCIHDVLMSAENMHTIRYGWPGSRGFHRRRHPPRPSRLVKYCRIAPTAGRLRPCCSNLCAMSSYTAASRAGSLCCCSDTAAAGGGSAGAQHLRGLVHCTEPCAAWALRRLGTARDTHKHTETKRGRKAVGWVAQPFLTCHFGTQVGAHVGDVDAAAHNVHPACRGGGPG